MSSEGEVRGGKSQKGLAYDAVGSGPALVLIHGTNLDRRLWADEVLWLKKHARVMTYDLRGQGDSDFPDRSYGNHTDLLAFLDELGVQEADLVGLSAGAQVALDMALTAPKRVRRIVLMSPTLTGFVPTKAPPFFEDLKAALSASDYRRANRVLLESPLMRVPAQHRERVSDMVATNSRLWKIDYRLVQHVTPSAFDRLEMIKSPTLVLAGGRDLEAVREQAWTLDERLPESRLVMVDGGGHLLNLTSPIAVRSALSEFFGFEK